jgi:ABC-type dipeptide/oligopeptide/nickel transport system permease component
VDQLLLRFPATLELAIAAMLIASIVGLTAGIISATKYNSLFDYVSMLSAIAGVCIPAFWLGLMLMLFFSVGLGWFPSTGRAGLNTLVLPAVTLSAYQMAVIARMSRSSMLEVIQQDYIRTARAKGLAEWAIIYGHALKNALIPTDTIVESVFAWPGLGALMIDSIRHRDYTMVQGTAVLYTTACLLINLLVDLVYAYLDPRVRYG